MSETKIRRGAPFNHGLSCLGVPKRSFAAAAFAILLGNNVTCLKPQRVAGVPVSWSFPPPPPPPPPPPRSSRCVDLLCSAHSHRTPWRGCMCRLPTESAFRAPTLATHPPRRDRIPVVVPCAMRAWSIKCACSFRSAVAAASALAAAARSSSNAVLSVWETATTSESVARQAGVRFLTTSHVLVISCRCANNVRASAVTVGEAGWSTGRLRCGDGVEAAAGAGCLLIGGILDFGSEPSLGVTGAASGDLDFARPMREVSIWRPSRPCFMRGASSRGRSNLSEHLAAKGRLTPALARDSIRPERLMNPVVPASILNRAALVRHWCGLNRCSRSRQRRTRQSSTVPR